MFSDMSGGRPASARGAYPVESERRDDGFVMVWFAVVMIVLLAVGAFTIDILHGYSTAQGAQNTADAAALAGVVLMPNFDDAKHVAQEVGADNIDMTISTVTPEAMPLPNQLKVTVRTKIKTFFGGVIGVDELDVSRSATAEYDQPVAMGSPANTFANQPDCVGTCTNTPGADNPQLWFNLAGNGSRKVAGDRFLSTDCKDGAADLCPAGGVNSEFDPGGYRYAVHEETGSGNLTISIFDPAFVHVGDRCTDDPVSHLNELYAALGNDPRYQPGASQYCTGDQFFKDDHLPGIAATAPTTYYSVYKDPGTQWNESDDTLVGACNNTFEGFQGNLKQRRDDELLIPALKPIVTQYFRQWVPLCNVPAEDGSDYVVHMWTDGGSGHNRGSIRVAKNGSLASEDVSLFARGRMAIYQNNFGAQTEFYLARVIPSSGARALHLTFYDTGDIDTAGTLTVLPPDEATIDGVQGTLESFSDCTYTKPPAGPPFPAKVSTQSDCSVGQVQANNGWQGQLVEWDVPIPAGYTCDYADPSKCWIKIRFAYPGGGSDTTTWQATLGGSPVRLTN